MDENLQFHLRLAGDGGYLLRGKFTGEDSAGEAERFKLAHPREVVNGHLCGGV